MANKTEAKNTESISVKGILNAEDKTISIEERKVILEKLFEMFDGYFIEIKLTKEEPIDEELIEE